jgi:putative oxidoreductase
LPIKERRFAIADLEIGDYKSPLLGNNLDIATRAGQPALMNSLTRFADPAYCIMRLFVGLLFACHGGQKLLGFPPGGHGAGEGIMYFGAWIELVGGLLVALGLITRVAALISSGEMAVAYFMMHAKGGFFPILNHGEAAVFYCFVFLFIFFYGPGRMSLDALIFKSRPAAVVATS